MKVETARNGDVLTILLSGRLDILGKAAVINALKDIDFHRVKTLVFDLEKVSYLSSAGIQVLIMYYKYMFTTNKGRLQILNPSSDVFSSLSMAGLHNLPDLVILKSS